MSTKSNTNIPEIPDHSKPPLPAYIKMGGILKPTKSPCGAQKTSFTTDDISSAMLRSSQALSRESALHKNRCHVRSYSASGRLSSTPIKPSRGNFEADKLYISSLSSVHSTTNTAGSVENGCLRKGTNIQMENSRDAGKPDLPSKYLYRAVEKASSVSQDLGIFASDDKRTEPLVGVTTSKEVHGFTARPWRSRTEGVTSIGQDVIRTDHKDYLRELVQDIEDRSSSIGTGYTELQDIIHMDTRRYPVQVCLETVYKFD